MNYPHCDKLASISHTPPAPPNASPISFQAHVAISKLTAISGLSASTYSCGGEGSRFGGGVSDSFLKYLVIPTGSSSMAIGAVSSSVGGADESDESSESESDDIAFWGREWPHTHARVGVDVSGEGEKVRVEESNRLSSGKKWARESAAATNESAAFTRLGRLASSISPGLLPPRLQLQTTHAG